MRPPDEVKNELVRQWVTKAALDMAAADVMLAAKPPLLYPACFHAQQAAEKYLKAYLTCKQVEFPKTHSIKEILSLVATTDKDLAAKLLPATVLTPYGIDVRYPGDTPEPTHREAEEALALAKLVRDKVSSRLTTSR